MEKYKKFIAFLLENKGKCLKIERKYIPEILDENLWQINADDGLPELTLVAVTTIRYWGVSLEIKNSFLIIVIPKELLIRREFEV